jgi:phosphoribosyl-ATP pyrophosphohydrolase
LVRLKKKGLSIQDIMKELTKWNTLFK